MNTPQTYTALVTSQHQDKPKFMGMIAQVAAVFVKIQTTLRQLGTTAYDLDALPSGVFLDTVGLLVGVSRRIPIAVPGVFFTWDGSASVGWDAGIWQDPNNITSSITILPDDVYRNLIRARIAADAWNGTTEGAYSVWAIAFPTFNIVIQDNNNMSYAIAFQGSAPDPLTLALLQSGYLPLRPEGIKISEYFLPADSNRLFAWDLESAYLGGWDEGSWPNEVVAA